MHFKSFLDINSCFFFLLRKWIEKNNHRTNNNFDVSVLTYSTSKLSDLCKT